MFQTGKFAGQEHPAVTIEGPERDLILACANLAREIAMNAAWPLANEIDLHPGTDEGREALVKEAVASRRRIQDAVAKLDALVQVVDGPRLLVCRRHRRQFSAATPCPSCAAEAVGVGFVEVALPNQPGQTVPDRVVHLKLANGRTQCGDVATGTDKTRLGSSESICERCHASAPPLVWHRDFAMKPADADGVVNVAITPPTVTGSRA